MTNLIKNTMSKTVLISLCLCVLTACISSPEKSTHKINAINNVPSSSPKVTSSSVAKQRTNEKDRCDSIKPSDEHYNLCKDRERRTKTETKNDSVVFEWKKQ